MKHWIIVSVLLSLQPSVQAVSRDGTATVQAPVNDAKWLLEDFRLIGDVLWRGELRYLDYGKNVWVSIPSNLRVTKSEQDAATWLWSYGYDDEPHANAKDGIRIADDGTKLGKEEVISREVSPNGSLRIVTTMPGEDDQRAAQFRFTYTINSNSFERKKEVKLVGSEDYFVRHVYAWKRQ